MTLSWGKSAENPGHLVRHLPGGHPYPQRVRHRDDRPGRRTAAGDGLHLHRARPRRSGELVPDSTAVDLTTPAAPGKGPSTAPTDLEATARKGSIDLTWTPPDTGGEPVEAHELYLNGKPATTIVWGAMPTGPTATYTMTVTDKPGTRYSISCGRSCRTGNGGLLAQRTVVVR